MPVFKYCPNVFPVLLVAAQGFLESGLYPSSVAAKTFTKFPDIFTDYVRKLSDVFFKESGDLSANDIEVNGIDVTCNEFSVVTFFLFLFLCLFL